MLESEHIDRKSLRTVLGKTADWVALAQDCVCFANGRGGQVLIGIEDSEVFPPSVQRIPLELPDQLRKRVGELTVNVQVLPEIITAENGGEYVVLNVLRSNSVASTSDGRYFLRISDTCIPVVGDDVLRLASERPGSPWETMTTLGISRTAVEPDKLAAFVAGLRASDRVKQTVKDKTPDELLAHYGLAEGELLTHLGVLLLGRTFDRARLGTAASIQYLKYDERGERVSKLRWDDFTLSPLELVDAVWHDVPDFRESYEIREGLYVRTVPAFDKGVIRELLVNALVHRPYTQRGDVFLNMHPDRLEVVNPGRLPIGVTPQNILHTSVRRNDGLARVFHDLNLMEKEGSGFDLMFERLLASGRAVPAVAEGTDSVHVTIQRRVLRPELIKLLEDADQRYQLTQRERITLGVLAQSESLSAADLAQRLEVPEGERFHAWLGRLLDLGLVETSGKTKGVRYFVAPHVLRGAQLDGKTTLQRISPHRLRALVVEDLGRYPDSSSGDINRRIGAEIPVKTLKRALDALVESGEVAWVGEKRWRRYRLAEVKPIGQVPQ